MTPKIQPGQNACLGKEKYPDKADARGVKRLILSMETHLGNRRAGKALSVYICPESKRDDKHWHIGH